MAQTKQNKALSDESLSKTRREVLKSLEAMRSEAADIEDWKSIHDLTMMINAARSSKRLSRKVKAMLVTVIHDMEIGAAGDANGVVYLDACDEAMMIALEKYRAYRIAFGLPLLEVR